MKRRKFIALWGKLAAAIGLAGVPVKGSVGLLSDLEGETVRIWKPPILDSITVDGRTVYQRAAAKALAEKVDREILKTFDG